MLVDDLPSVVRCAGQGPRQQLQGKARPQQDPECHQGNIITSLLVIVIVIMLIIILVIIIVRIVVVVVVIMIKIIIIIALKGAIQDFYSLLTAQETVSSMYAQVARAQSCANHCNTLSAYHGTCNMSYTMWYEGTSP